MMMNNFIKCFIVFDEIKIVCYSSFYVMSAPIRILNNKFIPRVSYFDIIKILKLTRLPTSTEVFFLNFPIHKMRRNKCEKKNEPVCGKGCWETLFRSFSSSPLYDLQFETFILISLEFQSVLTKGEDFSHGFEIAWNILEIPKCEKWLGSVTCWIISKIHGMDRSEQHRYIFKTSIVRRNSQKFSDRSHLAERIKWILHW